MSALSRLANMFRVADLRKKIVFTLFIIAIYRLGPHPGSVRRLQVDQGTAEDGQNGGGIVGFLDVFSGGAITNIAVFFLASCLHHRVDSSCSCSAW